MARASAAASNVSPARNQAAAITFYGKKTRKDRSSSPNKLTLPPIGGGRPPAAGANKNSAKKGKMSMRTFQRPASVTREGNILYQSHAEGFTSQQQASRQIIYERPPKRDQAGTDKRQRVSALTPIA